MYDGGRMALTIGVTGRFFPRAGRVLALPTSQLRGRVQVGAGADVLAVIEVDARAAPNGAEATGPPGEVVTIPVHRRGVDSVLLAGVGDGSPRELRKAAASVVRSAKVSESLAAPLTGG